MFRRTRVYPSIFCAAILIISVTACVPQNQIVSGTLTTDYLLDEEVDLNRGEAPSGWVEDDTDSKKETVTLQVSDVKDQACVDESLSGEQLSLSDEDGKLVAFVTLGSPDITNFDGTREIFEYHPDAQRFGRWGEVSTQVKATCVTSFTLEAALTSGLYSVEVGGLQGSTRFTREEVEAGIELSF